MAEGRRPSAEELRALREEIDPAALRGAAAVVAGPQAALLNAVADALEAPDDEAALAALEAIGAEAAAEGGDAEAIQAGVEAQLGAYHGDLELLRRQIGEVTGQIDLLREAQGSFAHGAEVVGDSDDEATVLAQTLRSLADERLTAPMAGVLGRVDETVGALQALLKDLPRDPGAARRASAEWRKRLAQLEADAAALDPVEMARTLLPAVSRFAALARDRDLDGAAEATVFEAALHEVIASRETPGQPEVTDGIWRTALTTAEAEGSLGATLDAARRLQAAALDAGDLAAVGDLAARVAEVAAAADDARAWCLACLEQAAVLAQLGRHEDSERVLDDVHRTAEGFVQEVLPRVWLTRGQALMERPDADRAAEAFQEAMGHAAARPGSERELGYALVGLCQAMPQETADGRVLAALTEARDLGLEIPDAQLHARAALNLVLYHLERDNRQATVGELIRGRSRALALAGEAGAAPFDTVGEELEARWGGDEVRAQIAAFMAAARRSSV